MSVNGATYVTRSIQIGPQESKKKVLFLKNKRTVTDPHFVAREELAKAVEDTCNELSQQGYEIISIFPTLRGESHATPHSGYGYSVTDGVIITAKSLSS